MDLRLIERLFSKTDDITNPPDDYDGSDTKSNLKETEVKTNTLAPVGENGAEVNGSDPEGEEPKILPFEPWNTVGYSTSNDDEDSTATFKIETHPFEPGVFDIKN